MSGFRKKSRHVAVACGALGLVALVEPAAGQETGVPESGLSTVAEAAILMSLTLVVGGALIKRYLDFTEGIIDTMRRKVVWSLLLGLIPRVHAVPAVESSG